MPRPALVTGAGGFVGANLVRRLLADGRDVTALVRPGGDRWRLEEVAGDVSVLEVDVLDGAGVARAVGNARPEVFFHLATHGAYSWQGDRGRILRTGLEGTANVLDAALRCGCEALVNAGSSAEYGPKREAPAEDAVLEPTSDYGVAKAAATLICAAVARVSDVHAVTLRLYSAYGPWEEPRRFVPQLVLAALDGALPPLASPRTARDFVHVDDVVDALVRAGERPDLPRGTVLNVGTGMQTTLGDAVEAARAVFGLDVEPAWQSMPDRHWDTDVWVADATRARDLLGWTPRIGFADGLRSFGDWLGEDAGRVERYRAPS